MTYEKKTWTDDEVIERSEMQNIEDGIDTAHDNIDSHIADATTHLTSAQNDGLDGANAPGSSNVFATILDIALTINDDAYDESTWNDNTNAASKNAIRDKIVTIDSDIATHKTSDGSDHTFIDQSIISGASPTFDGVNITNIDADTLIADVKEANVSAVTKGQMCAIVGSSGNKFEVQLCDCDDANLIRVLGLVVADTAQNGIGQVVHKGLLTNVNTQIGNTDVNPNGETWTAGDMLYVSNTPGGLTNVRPSVGRCIKAGRTLKGNSASDALLAIVHTNDISACAAAGEDLCNRMGDSDGVNKCIFKDYANNEVAAFDSNGNLTLIGNVDGRDANVDGTKLDTIEENAAADQIASEVSNTPAGNIIATDVQAAIDELDTEKAPLASPAFTGLVRRYATNGIVAYAGGGQANAIQLSANINEIAVCATAGDSVKLPDGVNGREVVVINNGAAALDVFPISGDYINNVLDTAISIPVGYTGKFNCYTSDRWESYIPIDDGMKDVANGIAALDANVQLDVLQMRPCFSDYNNHMGTVDNFVEAYTFGDAAFTIDAANHEMDLDSGTVAGAYASYATDEYLVLDSKPLVGNIIIDNLVTGAGGTRRGQFGFSSSHGNKLDAQTAMIIHDGAGGWQTCTGAVGTYTYTGISALTDDDLVTIVATSAKVDFLVNGVLVASHITNIPTTGQQLGVLVAATAETVSTAMSVSVDYIGYKKYF